MARARGDRFSTQLVSFGTPLGSDVVRDYANGFRLEKLDPAAARSGVRKPIVFYVDRNAPEPIRSALIEGIGWWGKAFDDAGYIDAFQVKVLPADIDPMDARYNVVNWVDRATRGWSYGQEIVDPRSGEIVKGMVVVGSLRVRQDIQIFEGLVGADQIGKSGHNDPVQVALERLRQLGAHEVGHTLGFAHNFAASTQDRASVMDYPPPLWDDGADPTNELLRLMRVRRAAIDQFGLAALAPGEPMAAVRRRFVPIWLLHRYQMVAAAKAIGGVELRYAVNGGGHESSAAVSAQAQRAALDAVLGTLAADQLRVPARLLPLLSAARNGSQNRQYQIELFAGSDGTVFDPLVAADSATELTLDALLAPARLARLDAQHAVDAKALGVGEVVDRLLAATLPDETDALSRRIAFRSLVTMAQVAHNRTTTPGVAALLDARVHDTAQALARRHGNDADREWGASLSRQLLDPRQLDRLLAAQARRVGVPPGAPIGSEADWMTMPEED